MRLGKDLYGYLWQNPYENNCNTYLIQGEVTVLIDPGHSRHVPNLFHQMEGDGISPEEIDLIVKMKLGMVQLAGYENHLPAELSGGMKKRAGLARAMAMDPIVLFFDEPSAGLDPITSAELDLLIKSINAGMGTTMVIVTHELQSILNIADRIIMLDKTAKGIIAEGNPKWLKDQATDPRVRNFFNRKVPEQEEKGT